MSNSPVDAARYPTQEQEDDDDELSSDSTHVSYRIKTDQIRFYKNKLINEPKLSSQAKAAINIAGNRFAKFEEIAYAKYVHKELAKAIGPNAPYMRLGQYQKEQAERQGQTLQQEASELYHLSSGGRLLWKRSKNQTGTGDMNNNDSHSITKRAPE